MNQYKKTLLRFAILVSAVHLIDATTTNIVPRSQSFNAARQMVGWNNPVWGINRLPQDHNYSSFNLTFAYTRTFRDNRLAQCLFGDDLVCGPCDDVGIKISGSAVADRNGETDWLADYFGLPRDYQSTVTFKPTISNFILDFSFYAGLDGWIDGMYVRVHAPFVHTKWSLNASECLTSTEYSNSGSYFQGYFSSVEVPVENLNTRFLNYTSGCTPTIDNNYDLYGEDYCIAGTDQFSSDGRQCSPLNDITWNPLCCGKISNDCECDGVSRNGFGEIRFVLGYNFLNDENGDFHMGLGAYVAAPTGTRVGDNDCDGKSRYLFEPIVGNGKHWELGAQVTAHHIWWRSEDADKSFGLYLEANVTHLFAACQTRCFDLCSAGSNSRYMLAERLTANRNSVPRLDEDTDFLGLEFANEYTPVANLTHRAVSSTIGAQGDMALSLAYQTGGFQWDVGYNFWGRTCEKLSLSSDCCPTVGQWALKGDQRVYGFIPNIMTPNPIYSLAVKMAATDSRANIHEGSNLSHNVDYTGALPLAPVNRYADNPTLTLVDYSSSTDLEPVTLPFGTDRIYSSNNPLFIQEDDFNLNGTRGISNKFFTHLNYAWTDREDSNYTPYLGLGAEVEFGSGSNNDCCNTKCDTGCGDTGCNTNCNTTTSCIPTKDTCRIIESCCENCSLTQWGIWFKVGASYN